MGSKDDNSKPTRDGDDARSFMMRKVSHEMRAPLAAIQAILDAVLENATHLSAEHRRMLERASYRSRSLMTLVTDLRNYWRLESLADVMNVEPLELHKLVAATAELFEARAKACGLSLHWQCQETLVHGDAELLRELVTNLVSNAIQYTPRGGRVDVTLRSEGDGAVLTVADTGIGINPEAQGHLFREFYRANEARAMFPDGTGLGLSIVKRIAELHGGRVEAISHNGEGTVFTVHLGRPKQTG